jgi:hypothetical protein
MRKTFLALAALAALPGCRHLDPWSHEYNLQQAQLAYTQNMRWQNFDKASQWVPADDRARFFRESDALRDVRISEYDIGEIEMGDGGKSAVVRVSYRLYDMRTLIERSLLETQEWSYGDEGWRVRPKLATLRDASALPHGALP